MIKIKTLDKKKLAHLAQEEGLLKLQGDIHKAGPEIEKFLSPFRQELGKSDPRFLNLAFGADWCACFVYYLIIKAGYKLDIKPFKNKKGTFGLVGIWYEWAKAQGQFRERPYTPEPGDLILYDHLLSDCELDHIGIILENHDNYCMTAEGNVHNRTGIFKRYKNETIRGYICL